VADDLTFLLALSDDDLRNVCTAFRSGRLNPPFRSVALQRFVSITVSNGLAPELQSLHEQGFGAVQIATLLDVLLKDRSQRPRPEDTIDLVTTGPDAGSTTNRDTSVVVRELFDNAEESVLVAGYAVYQGHEIDFNNTSDRHTFGSIYEQILRDLQSAGNAGEFYTPRAVTRFIVNRIQTARN
jgi:hypothetical protein